MKKMILLLAVASLSMPLSAQDGSVSGSKHSVVTNRFWSNWFVQGNVTWNAFYGADGGRRMLTAPFHQFPSGGGQGYTGLGMSVALGKWFTPGLGLRTKVNAWRLGSKSDGGAEPDKYWAANEQVLLNVSNLLLGYNGQRVWNVIPYIGAGINRNMSQNHYSTQLSCGLLNTFRLSRKVSVNAEIGWNSWEAANQGLGLKKRHQQLTAEIGLTLGLGKSRWEKATDTGASEALLLGEIDALNAQLADVHYANQLLQEELAKKCPEPTYNTAAVAEVERKPEKVMVAAPVSVFFEKGQARLASSRDRQNVQSLAETAKNAGCRVVVTGYADSKTGGAERNRKLSELRAQAVADELVRLGVGREKIEVVAAGGVDTLAPADNNRRATIELK